LLRSLPTEAPSLHRHYPASSVLRASPPPQTARPGSRELPVDPNCGSPLGLPVLRLVPSFIHAVAHTPAGLMRLIRSYLSPASAFPRLLAGRLLHPRFRGLLSVHSRYGLHDRQVAFATLYTGGFSRFVTSSAPPIATGWSDPVPGWDLHPLWSSALHGAQ
jgi:hypothetical protein